MDVACAAFLVRFAIRDILEQTGGKSVSEHFSRDLKQLSFVEFLTNCYGRMNQTVDFHRAVEELSTRGEILSSRFGALETKL